MADRQSSTTRTLEQETHHRRVAVILTIFAGILAIFISAGLIGQLISGEGLNIELILRGITVFGLIISARWIGRGQVERGFLLALTVSFMNGVLTLVTQDSQIPLISGLTLLLFLVLILYTLPQRQVAPALILVTLSSLVLIVADILWPLPRPSLNPGADFIRLPLAAILLLAIILIIIRGFSRFNLGSKLLVSLLTVSLLPLGVLAVILSIVTQNLLIADANRVLEVAAIQTASDVDNFLANGAADIINEARLLDLTPAAALSQGEAVTEAGRAVILRHLNSYRDTAPLSILSVALLDQNGRVVLDTLDSNLGKDESGRSYFLHSINNKQPYISSVEFLPDGSQPVLTFSAPVQDEMGSIVGVLRASVKASFLQDLVTDNTGLVGGNSFGVLFDENQLHLAHGREPDSLYKTVGMLPPAEIATLQASNRLPAVAPADMTTNLPDLQQKLADARNNPYFTALDASTADKINQVAAVPLRTLPWMVGYFQPQELFLAPIESLTRLIILAGVVIAGLVTVMAIVASRFLVQPIEQLTVAASQVASGDLTVRAAVSSADEIGTLATTFNVMTGRLETTLSGLEERVASRTQALETSARVSHSISTILNQDELVRAVVRQVYEAFDYYHVQIYIYQPEHNRLMLAAGYGRTGESPAVGQHSLAMGKGLVGRAADHQVPVLVADTSQNTDWVYNPKIPDTRSEAAVPISISNKILGVLDVQQDRVDGLDQDDVDVLQTFANQVAVALENARLFNEAKRRADRERLVNEISQKILDTNTMEAALQTTIHELGQAFQARRTQIELSVPDSAGVVAETRPVNGQAPQRKPVNGQGQEQPHG